MKNILYSCFLCSLLAVAACNENKKAKNYNEKTLVDDEGLSFIKKAEEGGRAEVNAGMVAQSKSTNPRVVNFAKMMIAEHTSSGKELRKMADSKFVAVADTISVEHQSKIKNVSALTGAEFDKAYMKMMVEDHSKVIRLFEDASDNTDRKITNFTKKMLPQLKMHLDSAKAISQSLK